MGQVAVTFFELVCPPPKPSIPCNPAGFLPDLTCSPVHPRDGSNFYWHYEFTVTEGLSIFLYLDIVPYMRCLA